MTMENFRLRVFRAVAQHLNFRKASEELLLTQPAVTQQIKALEAELDAALFHRTAGRITLTPAGAALLPYAERLAELAAEAREAVAAASGRTAGSLTLAASQTVGQYVLPRLLAAFLEQHPHVQVQVRSGNTEEALDALAHHHVQMALIEGPALRQDVRLTPFMEDEMVLVVPASHAWAGKRVSLDDLRSATWVSRELGSGSRRIIEEALEAAGLPARDLQVRMTFDSTEALLAAVEAGLGVAFVSRWAVRAQTAVGSLRVAQVNGLKLTRTFLMALPAGPEPTGVVGTFFRFLQQTGAAT